MRYRLPLIFILTAFLLSGCGVRKSPLSLLSHKTTLSSEEVNEAFSKAFPVRKKSSVGSIVLKRAVLRPALNGDKVALSVGVSLKTFEIPEGIDGVLSLSGRLSYDPRSKKIYLVEVTPQGVEFNDPILSSYVTRSAKSALNVIAMRELSNVEIYKIKKGFSARFIKDVTVKKGKIVIEYGL